MITIQKALNDLKLTSYEISKIAKQTGFEEYGDMSNLERDSENPDHAFYAYEIMGIMEKLDAARHRIEYLSRPIIETTTIQLNRDGRYKTANGHEYTCGSGIECLLTHEDGEQEWVWASVQHSDRYYITCYGNPPLKSGMIVRLRG